MKHNKLTSVKNTDKGVEITLSGDLSLNTASAVKTELEAYINKKEPITVLVKDVEAIDLSIFQLLQSFLWTKKQRNEKVQVELSLTDDQQQLVDTCGIVIRN